MFVQPAILMPERHVDELQFLQETIESLGPNDADVRERLVARHAALLADSGARLVQYDPRATMMGAH